MTEIDYGYGDQNDYGYGDTSPDMGYGDAAPDMGYGDAAPDMGYGNAVPDTDYGYGDASPDYGYGDASPDEYVPPPPTNEEKRPKRRCSVTKFSLASETPLTAASVINDLRMGLPPATTTSNTDDYCGASTVTDETRSLDLDDKKDLPEQAPVASQKKGGVISRIRRRLSIVS